MAVQSDDYANLESILATGRNGERLLATVKEWGLEFTGATPTEATFAGPDDYRLILFPNGQWRVVDRSKSYDGRA